MSARGEDIHPLALAAIHAPGCRAKKRQPWRCRATRAQLLATEWAYECTGCGATVAIYDISHAAGWNR